MYININIYMYIYIYLCIGILEGYVGRLWSAVPVTAD